jgi:hypothetical protein
MLKKHVVRTRTDLSGKRNGQAVVFCENGNEHSFLNSWETASSSRGPVLRAAGLSANEATLKAATTNVQLVCQLLKLRWRQQKPTCSRPASSEGYQQRARPTAPYTRAVFTLTSITLVVWTLHSGSGWNHSGVRLGVASLQHLKPCEVSAKHWLTLWILPSAHLDCCDLRRFCNRLWWLLRAVEWRNASCRAVACLSTTRVHSLSLNTSKLTAALCAILSNISKYSSKCVYRVRPSVEGPYTPRTVGHILMSLSDSCGGTGRTNITVFRTSEVPRRSVHW